MTSIVWGVRVRMRQRVLAYFFFLASTAIIFGVPHAPIPRPLSPYCCTTVSQSAGFVLFCTYLSEISHDYFLHSKLESFYYCTSLHPDQPKKNESPSRTNQRAVSDTSWSRYNLKTIQQFFFMRSKGEL